MNGTIIQQGRFVSTGVAVDLNIRSDFDSIHVWNETILNDAALAADTLQEAYWRRGMTNGRGVEVRKLGTVANDPITTVQLVAAAGFTVLDTSVATVATSANLITNIATGAAPRVTIAAHGYQTGDIVRISNAVGAQQLGAIDYRVTRVDANNFDLSWMPSIVVAAAPGAAARALLVSNEAFYIPKQRVIASITQAASAVVTMAAPHDFTVGQQVRFNIPAPTAIAFGMTGLDGVSATVTAISAANNTITVDADTSGFDAFAFPLTANVPFTPAEVVPIGIDTPTARANSADELADSTRNTAFIGVRLAAGVNSPAGVNTNVIYWEVRKVFNQ